MVSCRPLSGPLFLANLAVTVALLALTLASGRAGRRRLHYTLVAATTVALLLAIVQAELFGRGFEFDAMRLNVHLGFAFAALGALPGVAWSGVGLARGRVARPVHRRWVAGFVVLVVLAVATAGWMFLTAVPLEG